MMATRVRGELGPACARCGSLKVWTGTKRPGWSCRPCGADRTRRFKASKSVQQLEADRFRANEQRNARRAHWTPEKRTEANAKVAEWREANRARHRELARRWYAENSDRARTRRRERYEAEPVKDIAHSMKRKAILRDATCDHGSGCVDATFLTQVYAEPCFYCGGPSEDADHFFPISRGGLHCRDNIVPACGPCNGSKYNHDPIEWMASRAA